MREMAETIQYWAYAFLLEHKEHIHISLSFFLFLFLSINFELKLRKKEKGWQNSKPKWFDWLLTWFQFDSDDLDADVNKLNAYAIRQS